MTDYSYQLYSSRKFPPLEQTLSMLKQHGYSQVEPYGGLYGDVKALKQGLDANGLTAPTGHFGIDMLENEPAKVLDIAGELGMKAIYCPHLALELRPTDAAGWSEFGRRLEAAHAVYAKAGYIFGWHNHDFEFVALPDGSIPQRLILDAAPSISWEADIAWIIRGGGDPFKWIETDGNRLSSVHVKDIAASGENQDQDGWADVGHGTVDWKALLAALEKTPVRYFVLEHDNPADDEQFASRSIATLKAI
ncbi:sugar phosphate isomerase/epimerase [Phyllobacterium sp. 0TCS1.6C]|uniref:sugar phosphate isomerase/epimerase family protein n=1 Tax=unclassified Phyllobacterium TaxID=2638441 RepID=UPI002263DDB6|nr:MULTISPECIES: sugar phosphate isomerase/epimerase [unclassified Phyllobacterium]MCX8279753.1 sugar phosphate isomerase/epimerase [Phyllobacterium sp. 0TCS1.6C]MCX8295643.1 sugar phosphate isomerase/epimerase [Phyllobacterium sp. 0TCS1.6A]